MNRKERRKFLSISDEERKKIRRKALQGIDPKKYTDEYLDLSEKSMENYDRCAQLIEKAYHLMKEDEMEEARKMIKRCIFTYNAVQPEAYYIASEIITAPSTLRKIVEHYENNEFLCNAKKLKQPIEKIRTKHKGLI